MVNGRTIILIAMTGIEASRAGGEAKPTPTLCDGIGEMISSSGLTST